MEEPGDRSNLKVRDSNTEALEAQQFQTSAIEIAKRHGSASEGFWQFREEIRAFLPAEKHNPNHTRVAVLIYNEALKEAGIEDEMQLFYHFTSDNGAREIESSGEIKIAGKSFRDQLMDVVTEKDLRKRIASFFHTNNIGGASVYAAAQTPPEMVQPFRPTDFVRSLLAVYPKFFIKPKNLGIPVEKLSSYFEIVTAKSDKVFRETIGSKIPGIRLDEVYLDPGITNLRLGLGDKSVILGPYKNNFLENN